MYQRVNLRAFCENNQVIIFTEAIKVRVGLKSKYLAVIVVPSRYYSNLYLTIAFLEHFVLEEKIFCKDYCINWTT
jgi:hypothetical protein